MSFFLRYKLSSLERQSLLLIFERVSELVALLMNEFSGVWVTLNPRINSINLLGGISSLNTLISINLKIVKAK